LRSESAFPAAFYQRHNRDISEKGINEDVQDFANKHVERLPWPRSEEQFIPNGSKVTFPAAAAPALYQRQRNGKDISEKNIDAEVHGLANSMVDRINWNRSQEPFVDNGSKVTFPPAAAPSLYQRHVRDISEKNIDVEVHGLANSMVDRINWNRSQEPFIPNGSEVTFPAAQAASFFTRSRNGKDISEKNIDAEVHGLANSMVDRINWNRSQEPFIPNGSQVSFPPAAAPSLYQQAKHDIANKEVRPDVWVTVHNMVDPVAHWRGNKAPKSTYVDWWGEGEPPMQELEKPKCPEELEEQPNPMKKKLDK
jgi:DNA polymerase IIIc chi subunit